MKALVKKEAAEGLWLMDVPEPTYGPHDVLIRIKKTSICGTDVHIWKWDEWAQKTIPVPMVVGHEYAGIIEAVGSEVTAFKVGQLVSGEGHIVCGHCRNCRAGRRHLCPNTQGVGVNRPGAFAELLSIPADNVVPIPEGISHDIISTFDPLGNAVHTALSFDLVGEDVLITGAGPIGIMAIAVAKAAGARNVVITDVNEYRLNLARKLGPTRAVDVSKEDLKKVQAELGMTEGFDVALEMSGNARALGQIIDNMSCGGKIALLGIIPGNAAIDWNKVIFKCLHLKGIYGREMFETWYKMIALVQRGMDISPVITHKLHYTDFAKGFEAMISGQSGKVVLDWTK
ncbi:MAG: L-threonine 3-dehydrogenase [Puniceicoccales bacterium]|jgi:threonine 3-dehydrogenase|nr:L-threonine 3-dehydrogenase [Puniceicoccales bacterium]